MIVTAYQLPLSLVPGWHCDSMAAARGAGMHTTHLRWVYCPAGPELPRDSVELVTEYASGSLSASLPLPVALRLAAAVALRLLPLPGSVWHALALTPSLRVTVTQAAAGPGAT
eukprot:880785-Rhodomonas_salina.1